MLHLPQTFEFRVTPLRSREAGRVPAFGRVRAQFAHKRTHKAAPAGLGIFNRHKALRQAEG
ncbi:MAG: hypothetical protein JXR84_09480, partial [Anaerolineae bacterium]|nr:hypothetical protein [Anaerolineae bacterium]